MYEAVHSDHDAFKQGGRSHQRANQLVNTNCLTHTWIRRELVLQGERKKKSEREHERQREWEREREREGGRERVSERASERERGRERARARERARERESEREKEGERERERERERKRERERERESIRASMEWQIPTARQLLRIHTVCIRRELVLHQRRSCACVLFVYV